MSEDESEKPHPPDASAEPEPPEERGEHLADVPDGAGCTEIWDHLSDHRDGSGE